MDDTNLLGHSLTRQQQLMDEANTWRLQQEVNPTEESTERKEPIYAPALAKVGEAMVELGAQLQAKYSGVMQPDTPHDETSLPQSRMKPARS